MEREENFFIGEGGVELFYQSWLAESPKAHIILTHGQGEHSECYQRVADALVPMGLSIHAWDMRGHGRSPGKRGYVEDFQNYVDDMKKFVDHIKPRFEDRPFFFQAHSMGGLVTLRNIVDNGAYGAQALILSSPLLGLALKVPPAKEKMARFASRFMPKLTLSNEIADETLTHDPAILKEYKSDPYRHAKLSSAVFIGFLEAIQNVFDNAHKVNIPFFLQLSGEDKVVSTPDSKKFYELVGSAKQIKVYDGSYHEIYNDVEREQVFGDLKKYLEGQLP